VILNSGPLSRPTLAWWDDLDRVSDLRERPEGLDKVVGKSPLPQANPAGCFREGHLPPGVASWGVTPAQAR